ncbi:MAG: RHS repeat-associated core domain-containing protein [Sphingobacteriales bacterium]|nr:MAG: RHS repeat-associated core domain-containing protein [Sphingobacteriales bacterium]
MPIPKLSPNFEASVGVEANNYQYNGKELNEDFGLHWMDYGARWYNPQINRWGQVDPLAEKYVNICPYAYVANNPMIFVDPDGRNTAYYDQDGKLIHYSYDDLPDAVTTVGSENIDRIHSLTGGQRDASYSKEGASDMRNMGVSYMVEGIKSFALRSDARRDQTGNFFEADSNGKIGQPAKVESKNNLYTIDGKNVYVGSSYNDNIGSHGASESPKNSEVLFGTIVSDIHSHPYNNRNQLFYYKDDGTYGTGPAEFGPSTQDILKSQT